MPNSGPLSNEMSGLIMNEPMFRVNTGEIFRDSQQKLIDYKSLPLWQDLDAITEEEIRECEADLIKQNVIKFDIVFNEPIGYHFIKSYLETQHSVDKAIFIRDVQTFKTMP